MLYDNDLDPLDTVSYTTQKNRIDISNRHGTKRTGQFNTILYVEDNKNREENDSLNHHSSQTVIGKLKVKIQQIQSISSSFSVSPS